MARPREDDRDAEDGARANAAPTDAYPGVPGATKAEVDAFLAALDDFQPVVRRVERRRRRRRDDDGNAIDGTTTRRRNATKRDDDGGTDDEATKRWDRFRTS